MVGGELCGSVVVVVDVVVELAVFWVAPGTVVEVDVVDSGTVVVVDVGRLGNGRGGGRGRLGNGRGGRGGLPGPSSSVAVPLQNPAPVAGTPMASTTSITLSFSGVPSPKRNRPLELSTHTYVTVRLGIATDVVAGS